MAIDFPNSPSTNDTYTVGSKTWTYDGEKWVLSSVITLGTDTNGNYVASLVAGTNITITNNSGEGATPTVAMSGTIGSFDSISTPDWIQFDTGVGVPSPLEGKLQWNSDFGTLTFGLEGNNSLEHIGINQFAYCYNAEATTLNKGEAVYIFGGQGSQVSIKRALNTTDATSARTLGLVSESIASGASGYVCTYGVLEGINTSGYTLGDILYLGSTAGTLTTTKPVAPNHYVFIGVVIKAAVGGVIWLRPQNGYELDEIHDVLITSKQSGDFLKYDGTNWVNDPINLGTDTVGNYMTDVSAGTGISITHTPAEGSTATVALASGYGDSQNPYASKTANYFLAAPNGSAGVPTFRAVVAADIPTLNQNTTGSAASLSISGQTGLLTFTGLTTTNRAKTVRDAADTILELGGSYTPTGTWNWATATVTWPTFNQNTTGSAAKWTTARTITLGGDLSGNVSIDGSANVTLTATIDANTVALGTDTTGNYVATITGTTNEISVTGSGSETAAVTIGLPATTVTTRFRSGDGTLAAPAFAFNNETNTGLYSTGASQIGIAAGGVLSCNFISTAIAPIMPSTSSTTGFQAMYRNNTFGTVYYFTSSRNIKENIMTFSDSGDIIDQLRPVTFTEKITAADSPESAAWKQVDIQYGFIAEEVAEIADGHLGQYKIDGPDLVPISWKNHDILAVAVAEIKSLRTRVAQLEALLGS